MGPRLVTIFGGPARPPRSPAARGIIDPINEESAARSKKRPPPPPHSINYAIHKKPGNGPPTQHQCQKGSSSSSGGGGGVLGGSHLSDQEQEDPGREHFTLYYRGAWGPLTARPTLETKYLVGGGNIPRPFHFTFTVLLKDLIDEV